MCLPACPSRPLAAGTARTTAASFANPRTSATGDASGHDRQQRNEQHYPAAPANGERQQQQPAGQRQCASESGAARTRFVETEFIRARFFEASRRPAAGGDFYYDIALDAGAERFAGGVKEAKRIRGQRAAREAECRRSTRPAKSPACSWLAGRWPRSGWRSR